MSEFDVIDYSVSNRVATIKLNRPEVINSFNQALRLQLLTAIEKANADSDVRVVVVSGEGRAFSAGADLAAGMEGFDSVSEQLKTEYKPIMLAIDNADKLYISAINGACAGIGTALAMVCDLSIMADNAYIYQAFAAIALVPDGGATYHLLSSLGYRKALEVIIEGQKLNAEQCLQYGLTNKVVPADNLMDEAQNWAETLAAGAPCAQMYVKKLLKSDAQSDLAAVIDLEAEYQEELVGSKDNMIGVNAFFNKEKPVFVGE